MSKEFYDLLNASLQGNAPAHALQLVRVDDAPSSLELLGAHVGSLTLPRVQVPPRTRATRPSRRPSRCS